MYLYYNNNHVTIHNYTYAQQTCHIILYKIITKIYKYVHKYVYIMLREYLYNYVLQIT